LLVGVHKRRREGRDVDGVADGLITRRVYDVTQGLLGVLDRAALWIPVSKENKLLKDLRLNIHQMQRVA